VAHGTVWVVLSVAVAVAAVGGMFSSSAPMNAAASTLTRSADVAADRSPEPPASSGEGRRIVFDQSAQRVWLVAADGEVQRSYLVSGSDQNNVRPGTYSVKSRTRYARAYNGSGSFEYFVRFTHGRRAPIGFHSVTENRHGELVLARDELGTPRTPGCVEQWRDDAAALWAFAPVGTPVVVTT
jgi:lipoprotein-anchoring transpeptidase ErfK/SrfK